EATLPDALSGGTAGPAPGVAIPDVSFAEALAEDLELAAPDLEPATLPEEDEPAPDAPETLILAIETSCDETSAAVLRGDRTILRRRSRSSCPAATPCSCTCSTTACTRSSVRRWTTPPERPSTRWLATWVSATREAPWSTSSPPPATRRPYPSRGPCATRGTT